MPPKVTRKAAATNAPPREPMFPGLVKSSKPPEEKNPNPDDEDNDPGMVAGPSNLSTILKRPTQMGKDTFIHESIIGERIPKGTKNETEHLIIPLPEWRRFGTANGCDEVHLAEWKELKASKETMEVENDKFEEDKFDRVVIHRYHPVLRYFNEYNNVIGGFDSRDREEAMEMLGHMLRHVQFQGDTEDYVEDEVKQQLNTAIYDIIVDKHPNDPYTPRNAVNCAKLFLRTFGITQRGKLARDLLIPIIVEDEDWISAFAVAILKPGEVLDRMEELQTSHKTDEKRQDRYRQITTKFLTRYHEWHKSDSSFVYVFHIFYVLNCILREPNETDLMAEPNVRDDDDAGSDDVDDEQEGSGDEDDSEEEETQREVAKKKEPAKQETAQRTRAKPSASEKPKAPPVEGRRRSTRTGKESVEYERLG
ncbi:hypothetical protein N0V83_010034 [Neocucurbitaria cava]|uniref:Uncharacterized protein n=1 Tax=Neocucurbitaria cava TaxID=798079 RepID=A0A9W8Y053_9PLEO|nr:hypothetical protein N0V83_010034 [Neocucurbitaria cava]